MFVFPRTIQSICMNHQFRSLRRALVKCLTAFFLTMLVVPSFAQLDPFLDHYDSFMGRYVNEYGTVDYANISKSDPDLIALNEFIANTDYSDFQGTDKKAYWINVYNLIVVREVVQNYPINSVQEVSGFFSTQQHQLGSNKHTLDDIENKLLRKEFPDARLHFVLNCGAASCPRLLNEAYRPKKLENQMDQQTKTSMTDLLVVNMEPEASGASISKIFFWFAEDFKREGGERAFINKHRTEPIPENYSINYLEYDWSLNGQEVAESSDEPNLQAYTPSALFSKGQWEFKTFFNLYTQTTSFSDDGLTSGPRSTFFTSINQFLIGISPKINVGADFWAKSVLAGGSQRENALNIFSFPDDTGFVAAPLYLGPKVKIAPFKKVPRLSIQSTFLIPVAKDFEGRDRTDENAFVFLEFDRQLWINDIFFDQSLGGGKWQAFVRASIWTSLPRNSFRNNPFVETPIAGFISYFPTSRITIYGQTEFWPKHIEDNFLDNGTSDNTFSAFNTYFVQSGLGGKYQLIPGLLELEALYTNFWIGSPGEGAGQTFNFGLRVIR